MDQERQKSAHLLLIHQGLGLADWEKLEPKTEVQSWSQGRRVNFEAGKNHDLYLLLDGWVLVGRKIARGREAHQHLAEAGEWLGELLVLEPEFPSFFVKALRPSKVLKVSVGALHRLMMQYPTFNMYLVSALASRLRQQQQRQQAMLQQSARERIAAFLCEYCLRCGVPAEDGMVEVPHLLSHSDMAKFTATSRQSVNSLLTDLRRQGLLEYDDKYLTVATGQLKKWQTQHQRQLPFFQTIGQSLQA